MFFSEHCVEWRLIRKRFDLLFGSLFILACTKNSTNWTVVWLRCVLVMHRRALLRRAAKFVQLRVAFDGIRLSRNSQSHYAMCPRRAVCRRQCTNTHLTRFSRATTNPGGNRQAIMSLTLSLFMAALAGCGPYILPGGFISFFLCIFFHRLISATADWMSTILRHMVWP